MKLIDSLLYGVLPQTLPGGKKQQLVQFQTSSLRTFYKAHKNLPTYLDSMSYVNFIAIDLLGIIHVTSSIKIDLSW